MEFPIDHHGIIVKYHRKEQPMLYSIDNVFLLAEFGARIRKRLYCCKACLFLHTRMHV